MSWAAIRDAAAFAGREGAVWRVSVKPTDGPVLGARLAPAEVIYDWAGRPALGAGAGGDGRPGAMAGIAGHATLVRASEAPRPGGVFHPKPAPVAALVGGAPRALRPARHPEPRPNGGWPA